MRRVPLAVALGGFLVAVLADAWFLGGEHYGDLWWSAVYGFSSLFGLFGSLAIILIAKFVLGPWLQRGENYYQRRNPT
jgi:hypothetical protein